MKNKKIIIGILIIFFVVGFTLVRNFFGSKVRSTQKAQATQKVQEEKYWTCGMHPSVRVTDEEYKKGKKNCPICNMPLIPLEEKEPEPAREKTEEEVYYGCGIKEEGHCPKCDKGKPDERCICGGHSFIIKIDKPINCPVCGKPLKEIESKDLPAPMAKQLEKTSGRKILYYRNPMNPQITSQIPTKDAMGMDYIPVYEGELTGIEEAESEAIFSRVNISKREADLAGVMVEPVRRYKLTKMIRTVGKIAFHPELSVAQEEFLTAVETRQKVSGSSDPDVIKRADNLVEKSKFKLRLLGMSNDEIVDLERQGKAQMDLVLPEDKAWVYADVYEYELGWVKAGQEAMITTATYPGEEFKGVIKHISPVLNPMTRAATVRIEVDNTEQKLKPEMYADIVIKSIYVGEAGKDEVLAIPKDAVLDTGIRKIVYVDAGGGVFLGKEVRLGPAASVFVKGIEQQLYPVIEGLNEEDRVVTKANFLLDSQSQISGTAAGAYGGALKMEEEAKPPIHQH